MARKAKHEPPPATPQEGVAAVLKNIDAVVFCMALDAATGGDAPPGLRPPADDPPGLNKMYVSRNGNVTARQPAAAGALLKRRPSVPFGPALRGRTAVDAVSATQSIPRSLVVEAYPRPDGLPGPEVDLPSDDYHAPPAWGYLRWMNPGQVELMRLHLPGLIEIDYERVVRWDIETQCVLSGRQMRSRGTTTIPSVKPIYPWAAVRAVVAFLGVDAVKYAVGVTARAAAIIRRPPQAQPVAPGNPVDTGPPL